VRELANKVLHAHTTPARLALAVAVGCVIGFSPLFGLHLWISIALAWLLGLNQVVVYAVANISLPPTVPFIGYASVQLGERLRHGHWLSLSFDQVTWQNAPSLTHTFFVDWLVGGLVLGTALGMIGAPVTWALARRRGRTETPDSIGRAIEEASRRYRKLERKYRYYAYFKYRLDPCYKTIAAHVPPHSFTVDLGTGLGMLPAVLALLGDDRRALGVEWDPGKAAAAGVVARELDGVEIREGDARTCELPACDVITLVDLLHYYDVPTQRALLQRCRASLREGGRLLVREGDRARAGAARWTRFVERCATRVGWNRGPAVKFRPIAELIDELRALGFEVHADEVAGKLHPGNVLVVASRLDLEP
jgi:uncharacterized protein (DUF2062 family)